MYALLSGTNESSNMHNRSSGNHPKGKQEIRNELDWIRRAQLKVFRSVPYKQACSLNPSTSSTRRYIPAMTSSSISRMAVPDLPRAFLLL
jgi:hypothetical protein